VARGSTGIFGSKTQTASVASGGPTGTAHCIEAPAKRDRQVEPSTGVKFRPWFGARAIRSTMHDPQPGRPPMTASAFAKNFIRRNMRQLYRPPGRRFG